MVSTTYEARRGRIETYFDRTAVQAWARLTSVAPVGSIRATVRAGRDRMRSTLLDWLPADLHGARLLDAGCGTGALAVEAARRGADVLAIDLSPTLVALARERLPDDLGPGRVVFHSGDMLAPTLGRFDYVVGMDSMIHYQRDDVIRVLGELGARTEHALLFTFAPGNALLNTMLRVGKLFPRGDRAPFIEPVAEATLRRLIETSPALSGWTAARTQRIRSGFYQSQALELKRA
jgi:magnesium-protoporphyrin O-methyltransferase